MLKFFKAACGKYFYNSVLCSQNEINILPVYIKL